VLITLIGKIFLFFFEGRRDNHKNKPRARSPLPLPSRPGEFHPESLTNTSTVKEAAREIAATESKRSALIEHINPRIIS
jgi:hypothetical protein